MSRYVFDLETDGLLDVLTRVWIIYVYDLDTGKLRYWLEGDLGWKKVLDEAELLVGHNALGFDFMALKKVYGYLPKTTVNIHDTLLLSQILDYRRFGSEGHSMEAWGIAKGCPKVIHEDWSQYSEEMRIRCMSDVKLNALIYHDLMGEYYHLKEKAPQITQYIRAEHAAAKWQATAYSEGWPFNITEAKLLKTRLEACMQLAYRALSEKLGTKTVAIDKKLGIVESKLPKWTLKGFYDLHTAAWFGVDPCSGYEGEERIVEGEFSRVTFEELSLDSVSDVKIFLYRHGWQPTEWNVKTDPDTGHKKRTSPKITEDSLEFLGGDGKLYVDFLVARSRLGILNTWIENTDDSGNLHGDCMVIGTPSMRTRHRIVVNVPAAESVWGPEMRSLFGCKPGWKLIGCDSSGNQARSLAHYLGDPGFINTLLNGDNILP